MQDQIALARLRAEVGLPRFKRRNLPLYPPEQSPAAARNALETSFALHAAYPLRARTIIRKAQALLDLLPREAFRMLAQLPNYVVSELCVLHPFWAQWLSGLPC